MTSSTDAKLKRNYPVIAVSMGDMNGVGPEVIIKALFANPLPQEGIQLFGPANVMEYYADLSGIAPFWSDDAPSTTDKFQTGHINEPGIGAGSIYPIPEPGQVLVIPSPEPDDPVNPGTITAEAGAYSMQAISSAVSSCLSGNADAIVTAPISKEAISKAGYRVPGHTEYLAELTQTTEAGMMLVNEAMRVGLATIHIPLQQVAGELTKEVIKRRITLFHRTLQTAFGISSPVIAALGLNPHAGDGGVIGKEETEVIEPAIAELRSQGLEVSGPWPADGFFGKKQHKEVDMVFAMYHDQGLIPFKLAAFGGGVNITAGLPVIRTSPDHGTAFSIAGTNSANASSMQAAFSLALQMIKRRFTFRTG